MDDFKMKGEMGNGTGSPEIIVAEEEKRDSRRLGIKEFIITLIIIVIVWALQKYFDT